MTEVGEVAVAEAAGEEVSTPEHLSSMTLLPVWRALLPVHRRPTRGSTSRNAGAGEGEDKTRSSAPSLTTIEVAGGAVDAGEATVDILRVTTSAILGTTEAILTMEYEARTVAILPLLLRGRTESLRQQALNLRMWNRTCGVLRVTNPTHGDHPRARIPTSGDHRPARRLTYGQRRRVHPRASRRICGEPRKGIQTTMRPTVTALVEVSTDAVVEREEGAEAGLTEACADLLTDAEVAEVADYVADGAHGEIAEVMVVAAASLASAEEGLLLKTTSRPRAT